MMRALRFVFLALSIFAAGAGTIVSAEPIVSPISWGTAQNISSDSDVSLTGTLLYAYNLGSTSVASTTVNGVTFAPFPLPDFTSGGAPVTVGDVSISESPGDLYGNFTLGSGTTPFTNLSSSYKSLLGSAATAGQPGTITLQLGGLTPGQAYDFQWWSNNSTFIDNWSQTIATAGGSVSLNTNTLGTSGGAGPGVEGGTGQFAIGRFTADSTTYSIAFDGDASTSYWPLINGFQVRAVAVPEPSTYAMALAGIACGGFSMWRRRKRT